MANFKDILLHIFSQTDSLEELGKVDNALQDWFEKAQKYACGGEVKHNQNQKNLQSIFDGLGKDAKPQGYYFEAKELSLQDFNFPKKESEITQIKDVLTKFKTDFEQIKAFENKAFAETCLALLEKYFCYVPCGVVGLEEVSLFDYIKSVAGFMVCLQNSEIDKEKPFLLIGGDISGIQAFIYDIISTDASKNLKGRSFYLQLLVDSVIRKILKELELFSANIVYASGGGFYILAPNTKEIIGKLENLEEEISNAIFKTHKTAFSLAIAWEKMSSKTILEDNLIINPDAKEEKDRKTVWDTLIQRINQKQKRKHQHQILTDFDKFFSDKGIEVGGNQERDAITGEELDLKKIIYEITDDGNKKISQEAVEKNQDRSRKFISEITKDQIELGQELKDFEFLVSSVDEINIAGNPRSINFYNPCDLGIYYCFLNLKELGQLDFGNNKLTIQCINKVEEQLLASFQNSPHTYIFSFYGGNKYPTIKVKNKKGYEFEAPKTFSEMAGQKDEEDNRKYVSKFEEPQYKRLGVLRMDVDGLGSVFSKGEFAKNESQKSPKLTFSKYAALSRSLDYFFKGYLNEIWKQSNDFRENTQIIYSGGDDLFIVGRWDYLIEFAEEIQKKFECWTCQNPKLGISGGIEVVPPKYPIAKAAKQSEEFEKASKNHQYPNKEELEKTNPKKEPDWEKNAICFLDEKKPLHWENEFKKVKALKEQLQDFVKKTENNSILQRIQAFDIQRKFQIEKDLTHSWRWLLAYDFARFRDRVKGKNLQDDEIKALKERINQYKASIFCNTYEGNSLNKISNYEFIELLALAARWAELENRTRKQDK